MQTHVGVNDPKAVKRWATSLAVDVAKQQYFKRFTSKSENSIIQEKVELQTDAGDMISFDLSMRLREKPTFGDDRIVGKEEALNFYTDKVLIDQVRKSASAGGRMSRKRTLHDFRKVAKARASEYAAEWLDELHFAYLSGGLGVNEDALLDGPVSGNPFQAPDAGHILYGGGGVSKATVTSSDKMSVALIERLVNKSKMINARDPDSVSMRPVKVNSSDHYILLMNPDQEYDLRTSAGDREWSSIQRASAAAEGRSNPLFNGSLGMIAGVVLHCHSNIRRFNDYGAAGDQPAARGLFMGRQAGTIAYGTPNKQRMFWNEETIDAGNDLGIYYGMIVGMKKTRFNNRDFGCVAVDTYATDPN